MKIPMEYKGYTIIVQGSPADVFDIRLPDGIKDDDEFQNLPKYSLESAIKWIEEDIRWRKEDASLSWFFIHQTILNGDFEYDNKFIMKYKNKEEAEKANASEMGEDELDDNGLTATSLIAVKQLTDEQYNMLREYI